MLRADKLGVEMWFAIFEKHFYDFCQIFVQIIQCRALRMGTRKARHITHV